MPMGEIVRFPFEETLDEYTKSYHDNDEYTRLFYVMDSTLKYIHGKGYYVINFNPKNIVVGVTNDNRDFVNFKSIDVMDDDVLVGRPCASAHNGRGTVAKEFYPFESFGGLRDLHYPVKASIPGLLNPVDSNRG